MNVRQLWNYNYREIHNNHLCKLVDVTVGWIFKQIIFRPIEKIMECVVLSWHRQQLTLSIKLLGRQYRTLGLHQEECSTLPTGRQVDTPTEPVKALTSFLFAISFKYYCKCFKLFSHLILFRRKENFVFVLNRAVHKG